MQACTMDECWAVKCLAQRYTQRNGRTDRGRRTNNARSLEPKLACKRSHGAFCVIIVDVICRRHSVPATERR